MTDDIRQFIVAHESEDAKFISQEIQREFKTFVPSSTVLSVRAGSRRSHNVQKARQEASDALDDSLKVMAHVKGSLLSKFNDETLNLKDRVEVAKELRQWVKFGTDMAGIKDDKTDTLFVIDGEWDHSNRDVN
jgi:hypothetical protein